jgi:hypothetical protein
MSPAKLPISAPLEFELLQRAIIAPMPMNKINIYYERRS